MKIYQFDSEQAERIGPLVFRVHSFTTSEDHCVNVLVRRGHNEPGLSEFITTGQSEDEAIEEARKVYAAVFRNEVTP